MRNIRVNGLTLVGSTLLAASFVAPGQATERGLVFSSAIDMVNLPVTVTDKAKRFVASLTPEDFQVSEDGVPQEVRVFDQGTLPLSLVVLIDGSTSMQPKLLEVRAAATRFLETLRPSDRAQVAQFTDRVTILQDFTSDLPALRTAVQSTQAEGNTSLYTALYVSIKAAMKDARDGETRRRAVIVLSDGSDTSSSVSDEQVLQLARRGGVTIYPIQLRSLLSDALTQTLVNPGLPAYFFAAISRETGGEVRSVVAASQLGGIYQRVAEELHSQYSLGYVSSNPARDGRWRQVTVSLRPAALTARYPLGYYASKR
jgi:Ca-activated chloride channel family protein